MSQKTQGEIAYEADLRRQPLHDDGTPRKRWEELADIVKYTWERNPTPREHAEK